MRLSTKLSILLAVFSTAGAIWHGAAFAVDSLPTAATIEAQAQYTALTPSRENPILTARDATGHKAHVFANVSVHPAAMATRAATTAGALLYNGGPVMTELTIYSIFWAPSTLQSGASTTMTPGYRKVLTNLASDYSGHALDNNNTQYYQTVGTTTTYVSGLPAAVWTKGATAPSYVDTDPYPGSGCTDTDTPGNCITDAQIQAEIAKVMTAQGWTGGIDKIFMVYTAQGEGSCFDSTSTQCAYTYYCAYHSYFLSGSTPVVYANMPYGNPSNCQVSGTPSPNNNAAADTVATAAAHEITEAVTDPELDAWFDASGNEIGDLCAYNYGTNRFDGGKANQVWNGHYYELQMMYDNAVAGCVQIGP